MSDKKIIEEKSTSTIREDIKIEKKETINIEKDKLDAILNINQELRDRVERIESATSKAGLAKYDSQHQKTLRRKVKLIQYDGLIVKSWSDMLKNKVEKNVKTKTWEEDQIVAISFFDSEEVMEIHYETFNRNYTKIEAEIIKETINMGKDEEKMGNRTYTVKTKEGKEYTIGKKFVN